MPPPSIAVIGGGITGLAAAWQLTQSLPAARIVLFEAADRIGGKLWTGRDGDWIFERGADSWLATKPWAIDLARELGIDDQIVTTDQSNRGTFIVRNSRLHPIPEGLSGLIPTRLGPIWRTTLLSPRAKARLALEPMVSPWGHNREESISGFVRRRLGAEAYQYLVEPLLTGIYAGDGDRLSLDATFPQLRDLERQHGSLLRGVIARKQVGTGVRPGFLSFTGGLSTMVESLGDRLAAAEVELRTGFAITAIEPERGLYRIGADLFDHVLVATDAANAARLLTTCCPAASRLLDAISLSSTVTVTLGFDLSDVPRPLIGHGYVVPTAENRATLAMTWASSKWRDRAPDGNAHIRLFLGRVGDDRWIDATDDEILAAAREEAREMLSITALPELVAINRWRSAMPQYEIGHQARVAGIEHAVGATPGLALAGNYLRGVGIPDCIREGLSAAQRLVADYSS